MRGVRGAVALVAALASMSVAGPTTPARAEATAAPAVALSVGDLLGQVVVSDVLLAPGVAPGALRRFQRSVVGRAGGFWRLHIVAFLGRSPGEGDAVTLVAYDVTAPGQRQQVKVFEVAVEAGARTLHLNDFVVSEAMGFLPGHRFELVIEPAPGAGSAAPAAGKLEAYAKGAVTLR